MKNIIKLVFIFTLTLGASHAFSQGVPIDGKVTIQAGFCEDEGFGSIKAFNYLEKNAASLLLKKANLECPSGETAKLTNNVGQKDIKRTISEINITGCIDTVYSDYLAEATSGYVCNKNKPTKPPCCYNYCAHESYCQL